MAVNEVELGEIEAVLSTPDAVSGAYAELRQRFPHLSWTRCDAADVVEEPFRSCGVFDIHLIDSRDHCTQITSDPACATGFILAKRSAAQ